MINQIDNRTRLRALESSLESIPESTVAQHTLQRSLWEMPGNIAEWLGRAALLYGIPFQYLIPDARMLPPESLRFFYIDANWLDALVDGASSVGAHNDRDVEMQKVLRPLVRGVTERAALAWREAAQAGAGLEAMGPSPPGQLHGLNWHDLNGDGALDSGESRLEGWTIVLDGEDGFHLETTTDEDGAYRFADLSPGTYTVNVVPQPGWQQTRPSNGTHTICLDPGQRIDGLNFTWQPTPESGLPQVEAGPEPQEAEDPDADKKAPNINWCGFVLRSAIVSGWPGLEVKAYCGESEESEPATMLRLERVAPDLLFCILANIPQLVTLNEPPEGQHFGISRGTVNRVETNTVRLRAPDGKALTREIPVDAYRDEELCVIDMTALRDDLQVPLGEQFPEYNIGPANFAVQLIEAAKKQSFVPEAPGA